jgi:HD-like signal output (HDOD) protein
MEIDKKIADIIRDRRTQLPTLPVIVANILKVARDERTSAKDVADFISKDQAISNKLLRLANSSYYGLAKEVDSITRAITIIGFDEVISLTIGMSVFSTFRQKGAEQILDMKDLWLHSIGCALSAKVIAKKRYPSLAEQIFLNGLLHDTGKVILAIYFPEEYGTVLEDAKKTKIPLYQKEREKLGLDHAVVAGHLMERWNFPDTLLLPARFHHNFAACPPDYQHHAMIVRLANFLCQKAGIGHSGDPVMENVRIISQKLGFTHRDMETILKELEEQRESIEDFLGIIS